MTVYVASNDLPFTIILANMDAATARQHVTSWMATGIIFEVAGSPSPAVPDGTLVSFGNLRVVTVLDQDVVPDNPKLPMPCLQPVAWPNASKDD